MEPSTAAWHLKRVDLTKNKLNKWKVDAPPPFRPPPAHPKHFPQAAWNTRLVFLGAAHIYLFLSRWHLSPLSPYGGKKIWFPWAALPTCDSVALLGSSISSELGSRFCWGATGGKGRSSQSLGGRGGEQQGRDSQVHPWISWDIGNLQRLVLSRVSLFSRSPPRPLRTIRRRVKWLGQAPGSGYLLISQAWPPAHLLCSPSTLLSFPVQDP